MATSNFPGFPATTTLRVTLPDEVEATYERRAMDAGVAVEEYLTRHLAQTKDVVVGERTLTLLAVDRERIEKALGKDVQTPAALVAAVEHLTTLQIGGVKIQLSAQDQEEIKRRAEKNGISVKQEIERSFAQIKGLLLHGVRS